jgi:hypothetical protein
MQTSYYIYVYLDPRRPGKYEYTNYSFEYEPFYIGKGKDDRIYGHLKEVKNKKHRNLAKCNKINAILRVGKLPIILKIESNLNNDEANKKEKLLVKIIGRLNEKSGPLTNITEGGDGGDTFTNNPHKELIRQKMSVRSSGKRNPMYGKHHSQKTILQISKNRKGKRKGVPPWNLGIPASEETRKKLSKLNKFEKNYRAKKFKLISPNGDIFEVCGKLAFFCKEHNLAHSFMRYSINKGKIPVPSRSGSIQRKNLGGWEIQDKGYINQ